MASAQTSLGNVYAYSPYGETVALGLDEGNPLQYTGRENDGTGLYYYRARYYDPGLKRFIADDPIGVEAGTNLYAYVRGNPISAIDPTGEADVRIDNAYRAAGLPPPPPDPTKSQQCYNRCRVVLFPACSALGIGLAAAAAPPTLGASVSISLPTSAACNFFVARLICEDYCKEPEPKNCPPVPLPSIDPNAQTDTTIVYY